MLKKDRFGSSRDQVFEMLTHFAESNEVKWFGSGWITGADETANLFEPAAIRHHVHALLDLAIQRIAVIVAHTCLLSRAGG